MKTTIIPSCSPKILATTLAAFLLAMVSAGHVQAQTNTGTGPNANVVATNGTDAALSITSGLSNTAYGNSALKLTTTGGSNTAIGANALKSNVTGSNNTAVGVSALFLSTGTANTALGVQALRFNTTGSQNTATGFTTLFNNTTGSFNTATGREALFANTTGASNVANGFQALLRNSTGNFNVAIGDGALMNSTGDGNIGIGEDGGVNLTTGSNNIYIGNPGGTAGGGIATESGIIRIGFTKNGAVGLHTDTFLAGVIHGNGSALTGINGANLTAGSITSTQLASNAVTNAKLASGAVTAAKVAAGAITSAKLAAGAAAANLQAGNQTAVPSTGVLLSATDNNTNLTNAGYVKFGTATTSPENWTAGSTTNAPSKRAQHTAVWTGTEMIVWGGSAETSGAPLGDGGRYNPVSNTWTPIPAGMANEPSGRKFHAAVWTGTEMIVWGGFDNSNNFGDGGRYNPLTNTWTAIPSAQANEPLARRFHTAVWTGTEMIIWGGFGTGFFDDGGRFNPATNTWTAVPSAALNEPSGRILHTAVWTGSEMIVWGGVAADSFADGGRYDPAGAGTWTAIAAGLPNGPSKRNTHTAVWTGTEMIVWGGTFFDGSTSSYFNDGGRYTPGTNTWAALPSSLTDTPSQRNNHTGVWTGSEMIIFAGDAGASPLSGGARYNPAGNTWTTLTHSGEPAARSLHTAVWTGSEMIVFGGDAGSALKLNDVFTYSTGRVMFLYQRP